MLYTGNMIYIWNVKFLFCPAIVFISQINKSYSTNNCIICNYHLFPIDHAPTLSPISILKIEKICKFFSNLLLRISLNQMILIHFSWNQNRVVPHDPRQNIFISWSGAVTEGCFFWTLLPKNLSTSKHLKRLETSTVLLSCFLYIGKEVP